MHLTVSRPRNRVNLLDDGFESLFDNFFRSPSDADRKNGWSPQTDIHETENDYLLEVDLPGMDQKDVNIKVENDFLTISGERKSEKKSDEDNYHYVERMSGSFSRSFRLGDGIQADKIEASYENGVLKVTIPKAEQVKPKEIEIKVQ